jgi:hypothetical protein
VTPASRRAALLALGAAGYGAWFLLDVQPARESSWPRSFGLALCTGFVLVLAEIAVERLVAGDRTTDPVAQRALRVLGLLLAMAIVLGALAFVSRQM